MTVSNKPTEQRPDQPIWVKAILHHDFELGTHGVDKILLFNSEGERAWDWLIFPEDVAYRPREVRSVNTNYHMTVSLEGGFKWRLVFQVLWQTLIRPFGPLTFGLSLPPNIYCDEIEED